MNTASVRLRATIVATAAIAAVLFGYAVTQYPFADSISIRWSEAAVPLGVAFWVAITLLASAAPVRVFGGSYVDVASAPLIAVMSLGGPAVTAIVALIGTISPREARGQIPWYGIVANRTSLVLPAVAASLVMARVPGRVGMVDFLATSLGAACYFALNFSLAVYFATLATGRFREFARSVFGACLTMFALAPIAWLMAQMYTSAGWWAVLLFAVPLATARVAYQRFVEVRTMFTETVSSLAEAVDKRDKFTSGHSHRVQEIALDIGRAMKLSDEDLEALEWGGLLHDIGKIGVPDSVLLKEERLTRDERAIMNSHPVLGAEIIAPVHKLAPELPIIRHHHEWFNGSGYPDRLAGDEIPRLARILHVADAFEAMTAKRPYRMTPLTPEQALGELRKFGGIQFDPDVVDAFIRTDWARNVADPGRPDRREVPSLAQAAGAIGAPA